MPSVTADDYYIVIRYSNHLTVMSANIVALSSSSSKRYEWYIEIVNLFLNNSKTAATRSLEGDAANSATSFAQSSRGASCRSGVVV